MDVESLSEKEEADPRLSSFVLETYADSDKFSGPLFPKEALGPDICVFSDVIVYPVFLATELIARR